MVGVEKQWAHYLNTVWSIFPIKILNLISYQFNVQFSPICITTLMELFSSVPGVRRKPIFSWNGEMLLLDLDFLIAEYNQCPILVVAKAEGTQGRIERRIILHKEAMAWYTKWSYHTCFDNRKLRNSMHSLYQRVIMSMN